jgi:hypothetical protein
VPYIACYDEYVDSTAFCHRWDDGADPFEITMQYINTYREYYPLVNLQRDRVGFNPSAVGDRMTSRYFLPITNMYQQWLFSPGGEPLLNTYSQIAMLRGFSLMWDVMATPRYGSYALNATTSQYEWQSYNEVEDASLYLPPGAGRREFSRYDPRAGYNFFQRVLESGYFYEQLGALIALTSNDASVLGIGADVDADQLTYSIPYYLVFQEEIDSLFAGIVTRDAGSYGPYISSGELIRKDLWLEGIGAQPPIDAKINTQPSWSTRLYAMLYGTALLSSNYDASFLQKAQIGLVGANDPIEVAPNYEEVRVTDPISGRIYVAYRDPNGSPESFLGAKLLGQLQGLIDQLDALPADDPSAPGLRAEISNEVEILEILRSLYAEFQYVFQ